MKIGFIGAGQMAKALAAGIVNAGLCKAGDLTISDPSPKAINAFQVSVGAVNVAASNADCVANQDFVVFAVKPQRFAEAAESLQLVGTSTTLISVMGGIRIETIADALGTHQIVRVMPNTPCLVGAGACGIAASPQVDAETVDEIEQMLSSLGECVQVSEDQLDAITGLSGSGPAYVFSFIEALADGGVLMGLGRDQALKMAAQTVYGAAKMVIESGDHPAVLRDRVASPGGTTIYGLHALSAGSLNGTVMNAVQQATQRSRELGS